MAYNPLAKGVETQVTALSGAKSATLPNPRSDNGHRCRLGP